MGYSIGTGSRPDLIRRRFLIASRSSSTKTMARKKDGKRNPLATHPGDSGHSGCWNSASQRKEGSRHGEVAGHVHWQCSGAGKYRIRAIFVLATCLSTICRPVWNWTSSRLERGPNRTWGAVGHFSIAHGVAGSVSPTHRVGKIDDQECLNRWTR